MARDMRGMHMSNAGQDDLAQMLRAAPGCVTLLHLQLGWYGVLRYGLASDGVPAAPDRLLHIRMYHPNWTALDPVRWAEECVEKLASWTGGGPYSWLKADLWDDPLVCVSPANEPNLHYECGDPNAANQWAYQTVSHYERIAEWSLTWAARVAQLVPERKALLCTPAFADGHQPQGYAPDGEYKIPAVKEMMAGFDLVGLHPYALLHERPTSGATGRDAYWYMLRPFRPVGYEGPHDIGGVVSQYPTLRYLVSETGTFTHSDPARAEETSRELLAFYAAAAQSGSIVGVTPFIWQSDAAHPHNVIHPNAALRRFFETMPTFPAADLPVRGQQRTPTVPPRQDDPVKIYDPNPNGHIVGAGFIDEARRRQTRIVSDEVYTKGPTSEFSTCLTTDGMLVYSAATGTRFLAFE